MRVTLVAVLVLAGAIGPIGVGAGQPDVLTVDDTTHLATADAASEYRADGTVSATVEEIQLEVTVAQSGETVNASAYTLDRATTYVRVDYAESVPRDVRLHIDGDVLTPRPRDGMAPIDESQPVTADWQVTGDQQSVVLHLQGETHAVFGLSTVRGGVSAWKRSTTRVLDTAVQNATGYSLPHFGAGEWSFVPPRQLRGANVTYPIPDSRGQMTVQYRVANDSWLSVPECQADAPVCTLRRDNRSVIFAATRDPPRVRYKRGTDLLAGLGSAVDDAVTVPYRILGSVEGIFGGGG